MISDHSTSGLSRRELLALFAQPGSGESPRHAVIYQEKGRYGGWPANHGVWAWGDEILCGFSAAFYKRLLPDRQQYDPGKPEEPRLARSLDGGETWKIEAPRSLLPPSQGGAAPTAMDAPMDFDEPGFAMSLRFTNVDRGPSLLWHTSNKGKTWMGPFRFPLFGRQGIAARTDYIILDRRDALVFVTASKLDGMPGRPLCVRTRDGGLNWRVQGWIGEELEGSSIMPSSVRLSGSSLLCAVRVKDPTSGDWIELWASRDLGVTWKFLAKPAAYTGGMSGNPPCLIKLRDGNLCLTYAFRERGYGIRAVMSYDHGTKWTSERTLRGDGAARDIGYPRSVQRRDGRIATVYYFAERLYAERIIACTIWDPA